MWNKTFFIFLIFVGASLQFGFHDGYSNSSFKMSKVWDDEKKQKKQEPYSCEHLFYLCGPAVSQLGACMVGLSISFIGYVWFSWTPRGPGHERILTNTSFWKPASLGLFILALPYIARYSRTGHLRPTCYGTALLSPTLFIEVPYVFYQRNKSKKAEN